MDNVFGVGVFVCKDGRECRRLDKDGLAFDAGKQKDFSQKLHSHPVYGSIIPTVIDGQQMVRIPAFYVRQERRYGNSGIEYRYWISPEKCQGFHLHPAFMHCGKAIPFFHLGAYEASFSEETTEMLCSLPNVQPAGRRDFPWMRNACLARNKGDASQGWCMENLRMLSAVQVLMLTEFASTDMQHAVGGGNTWNDNLLATGEDGLCWRGIYDLWGNSMTMIDGIRILSGEIWLENDRGTGEYIKTMARIPDRSGLPIRLADGDAAGYNLADYFLPVEVNNEDRSVVDAFAPDYIWGSMRNCETVMYHGGGWGYGANAGLFCTGFTNVASVSNASIGSRLAKV
jgi:hypothetical protein